jgi:hypothetical protein
MAELESKVASYAEAAAEADMRWRATEEKLRRENEALRTLLVSNGFSCDFLEHDPAEERRDGVLDEMQTSLALTAITPPPTVEPHGGLMPLQLSNV